MSDQQDTARERVRVEFTWAPRNPDQVEFSVNDNVYGTATLAQLAGILPADARDHLNTVVRGMADQAEARAQQLANQAQRADATADAIRAAADTLGPAS